MTPEALRAMLTVIEVNAIQAGTDMLRGGVRMVPTTAIGVSESPAGEPVLAMMPILDLGQRFRALRQAVEKAQVRGFVFMFDGVVRGVDGTHDALLVVTCTPLERHARAIYYRREPEGLVVGEPVEAPDEIAAEYQRAFHVHPQPSTAGRQ